MRLSRKLVLIVLSSVALVTIPAAAGLYYYYKDKLLDKEALVLQTETDTNITNAFRPIRLEVTRLNFLSQLLQKELATVPDANEVKLFDQMTQRSADGAWRNKPDAIDSARSAGFFLPPDAKLDAKQKSLHVRSKKIIDAAAFGLNSYFNNLWLITHDKTEVISDDLTPDFILQMSADTDYTHTPWMTLGDPAANPLREMRWTEPSYDPVPKTWMISAVKPVDVNGVWIGNIGQDMFLQNIFAVLFKKTQRYRGELYFLIDAHGNYLQAGLWQQTLEANPGKFKADFSQTPLLEKLFKQKLENSAHVFKQQVSIKGQQYLAISTMIMPMGWRYYRLVPVRAILVSLDKLLITMGIAIVLIGLLVGLLIRKVIEDIILKRLRALTRKVYGQDSAGVAPAIGLSLLKKNEASLTYKPETEDDIVLASKGFDIALEQLKENECELQTLMDNIPSTVARVNRELRYEYVNKQHELVYGKSLEWILDHTMAEMLGKDLFAHAESYVKKALAGEACSYECAITVPSGGTTTGLVHLVPNLDEHRNVKGFFVLGMDISELKQSQLVIAASQNFLKTIIDIAPVQIFWKDINSQYLGGNKAFAEDAQLNSVEDLVGKFDTDLLWKDSAEKFQQEDQEIIESGIAKLNYEHMLVQPNGKITWARSSKVPLKNLNGEIIGVLGIDEDITERKLLEETRLEAQQQILKITNNVPGVVYQFRLRSDGSSCFPFASDAINYIFRVSPEEVREDASKVFAIIHPDDYDDIQTSIEISAKDLTLWHEEFRVWYEDGTIRWLLGNSSPEQEANGDILWHGFITDITETKLAEQQLRIAAIAFETQESVMITDANRILVRVNSTFVNETGYSEAECVGKTPSFLKSGRHDAAFFVAIMETVNKIGTWGGEVWNKRKNGEIYPVLLIMTAVKDNMGIITNYVDTTVDITEQKKTQQDLIESEYRWKYALEGAGDGAWDSDELSQTMYYSKAWKEMLGYSEDEITDSYDEWESRVHPEDLEATLAAAQECLDGKTASFVCEYRSCCKDGSYKWVLDRGAVVSRSADGKPLRMIGTVSDISERKKNEQALLDSEYRWKFAIEGSGFGVWDVNVQTNEASYSKLWKEMLGYTDDDIMTNRQEWIKRIHPDDKEHVLNTGQAYLDGLADSYVVEYRLRCKDDSYKWMLSRGMIVSRSVDGKPVRMIGTQTDVTERKSAQLVLQKTRLELEDSHDKYKDLYEFSPIGYLSLSSHGLITQLNWRASAMLGLERKHIIDKRITQFIDENDKARWGRLFSDMKALEDGEELCFDLKFTLHNGVSFYANLNCLRTNNEDEKTMLRIALEDVTMVKKSEAELRIAATAFESQDGLMITDVDSRIMKVNKAFTIITGYTDAEVVGNTPAILGSGRHDEAFFAAMWESIHKTGRWSGEIWNRRKSGEIFPENISITAVKNDVGIVTNYVATFTDVSQMKAAAEEIQQLAFFDPLTHLPNRRLLMDRLKHALATSARSSRHGAVLFIDLDHFKVLNDSLGHDIGDLLLQQVAERLTACVREGDTVARLGGDEYVVVLEDLSEQGFEAAAQTETIAHKILESINQPYQLAEHLHHITPSIGITVFENHLISIEELLKQADIAMYQAKKAGRNALRFFNPQMQTSITARVALERELRKALDGKQFQLHYQIQVDNSGQALGAEALIRWVNPERGLVSPAQFIPLAEETGLIVPIGMWVLDKACAQIKAWHKNLHTRDLTLSINVSAKQFHQADFVAQVRAAVERHGIDPMQLKLELTESLLLENIEDTIVSMTALGDIGVQFSLDDFGTGYSSLQYLKRLPLFQLKIDQSFVRDIVTDSHDRSIVRTIIAMAQSLYLNVIAEGVETEEQRELLLSSGCKRYQGYLFGKPLPIKEFDAALKEVVARKSQLKGNQLTH